MKPLSPAAALVVDSKEMASHAPSLQPSCSVSCLLILGQMISWKCIKHAPRASHLTTRSCSCSLMVGVGRRAQCSLGHYKMSESSLLCSAH